MYQINPTTNELIELSAKRFSDLGFREREHLQEWLANSPTALGEDLLIIQKEFDGFDETRERLDLLALDKGGNLVLIENKLDDSGRDVVWQSLKYASYCSGLKKAEIIGMYQSYLDRYKGGGNASELICEFIETEDISDVILNSGTEQRIKLVAANFRKEVTSTVLWLLQYNLQIQCYKATPYKHGENLFLNLEQIIPTPEAADFMIGITEKENEQKTVERSLQKSKNRNSQFWEQALEQLERAGVGLYRNVNPGKDHWLWAGSGLSGVPFSMIFLKSEARVEISITRKSKDENKRIYDLLHAQRERIEERFGAEFKWMRLDERISCRVTYAKEFDGHDPAQWPAIIDWLVEHIQRLEKAFRPDFEKVKRELKGV